jgi:4-amino-4-deoxy-L-arabinose transferase-like glycosyltransferase
MPVRRPGVLAYLFFLFLFGFVLFIGHASVLHLPYFWDELGQFVPASLDILQRGAWIPKTTLPNVHPPGVMAFLAGFWKLFGYSVENTRAAMLLLASVGVLTVFLLGVELCRTLPGLPALSAAFFLLASPLFFAQSFLAQLDMPAMVFTALALLLFLQERLALCALACTALVLVKETSIAVPAVFGAWLLWERRFKPAFYFFAPAIALALWLGYLYHGTGHIFGNQEFTHYNVTFQLHPVRLAMTLVRRAFYIFIDNFHWIGSIALLLAWRKTRVFRTRTWAVVAAVAVVQTLMVTLLGGAALERYLMPVLPLFYIAVAAALATWPKRRRYLATAGMLFGLAISIFVNSVFPYPYENNFAVVDFVRLQKEAAELIQLDYPQASVASAWPFPDALRRPEFGYVTRPISVRGLDNFNVSTVTKLVLDPVDVLVVYSRTWEPTEGVVQFDWARRFLTKYYFYEPQINSDQIREKLGMTLAGQFSRRGQWIEVYTRARPGQTLIF